MNPLSLRVATVLGIPVHVHVSFLAIALLLFASGGGFHSAEGAVLTSLFLAALLLTTLVHELGHALAARGVGGRAESIHLWGLGGQAHVHHPRRPGAQLGVALAGVGVDALMVVLAGGALWLRDGALPRPTLFGLGATDFVSMVYGINLTLIPLNLLPGIPFDGGSVAEALLWGPVGRMRARRAILASGTVLGLGLLLWGLAGGSVLLPCLGIWALYECGRVYQGLREGEVPDEPLFGAHDFSNGYTSLEASEPAPAARRPETQPRPARRDRATEEKRAREEAQARLDSLLDRIHEGGMDALSPEEKRFLVEESRRLRSRESR